MCTINDMKIGIKLYYVQPIYEFEQMCVCK